MSTMNFLQFYYYFIQYESNLRIVYENKRLLSFDTSWLDFCVFSKAFSAIHNDVVSKRYHYEKLKLTRLNLYAKILFEKFQYEHIHEQYDIFFARFYGSFLFIFDVFFIILSAMQIELNVKTLLIIKQ